MRGIGFIAKSGYKMLYDIFRGIDVIKYFWNIDIDGFMIIGNGEYGGEIFEEELLTGTTFLDLIYNNRYSVIFLDLFAYNSKSDVDNESIETYEDFLRSNCQLALFVSDCEYVEIYCKNVAMIEIIKKNAINFDYKDIEYITDENDGRTRFSVF